MTEILVSWPGGSLESTLRLVGTVIGAYALVLWLAAVVWVYRDVRNRTADQVLQVISVVLVAVFNLPGIVVYLVIRPQTTLADAYERSLETEAVLHELQLTATSCQTCRRPIEDDFNVCPFCRVVLREPCRACNRLVRTSWAVCPYCATERQPVRQRSAPPPGTGERAQQPRRAAQQRRRPQSEPATSSTAPAVDGLPRRPAPAPQQVIDS